MCDVYDVCDVVIVQGKMCSYIPLMTRLILLLVVVFRLKLDLLEDSKGLAVFLERMTNMGLLVLLAASNPSLGVEVSCRLRRAESLTLSSVIVGRYDEQAVDSFLDIWKLAADTTECRVKVSVCVCHDVCVMYMMCVIVCSPCFSLYIYIMWL